jgi:PhoH-like ATPase
MPNTITIDTNLLLDDSNIIYKLAKNYDTILIPRTVLKELDKHKYNPDLSYSARNAITSIRQFKEEYPDKVKFYVQGGEIDNNDAWIIKASKENNADLATKDISMSIIAEAEGLNSILYDVVLNNVYHPYNYINIEDIYGKEETTELDRFYGRDEKEYYDGLKFFSKVLNKELNEDGWFFIFINNIDKVYVYANNPIKKHIIRIDHKSEYNTLICDNGIKIEAIDIYQNCAIYAFREAPNVLITGKWGSGKSLLSSAYSVEQTRKKTFISRPPVGINSKYEIGFLPGDKSDKMLDWLGGFTSSLYYIYGNTNGQRNNEHSYNYVKDEIFDKKFEVLPLNSIQGLSLLENDLMIIDEIQLVSVDYMSMILSRPSENGKLILLGDLKQTYNIVKPSESGLLKLLRILPHQSMAFVNLENSYRSNIIELADKLQDKAIE